MLGLTALAIGLADAALIATARLGAAGAFQYIPARVWMVAPLCWAIVAVVFAVPSYALARRRGGVVTVMAMIALFVGVRFHAQPRPQFLAGLAAMLVAFAAVWLAGRRWTAAPKRIAGALTAAAFLALAAGAAIGTDRFRPPATRGGSGPDVVVAFLDTVPYTSIFRQGTTVAPELPFFSRMASQSIVFDRAYTTSPWTLPAHFSAVTGLPAHRLDVSFDDQYYDGRTSTLAQRFRRRGYRTAAVISNTFLNRGSGFTRGFEVFEHASSALDVCRTAPGTLLDRWWPFFAAGVCNWTASEVTRRAIAQVPATDQPLFLLLNYMDAHDPYYVESGCARPPGGNPLPREVPAQEYRGRYHASHLAAVRCIDRHLGDLAARLRQRKREAVFVVLADHGEHFGEHGLVRHGNSLYTPLLHVPFMIHAPGRPPRHITEPVSTASMARLITDIVDGRDIGKSDGAVVSSLLPPAALRNDEQWSVIAGRWHLIRRREGHALYDLMSDPAEERNLAGSPVAAPVLGKLSAELERESRTAVDRRLDEFRSLGYIR